MRAIVVGSVLALALSIQGEETELLAKGIAALKESQTNPKAIIAAARDLTAAAVGLAAEDAKTLELNAYIYWCAKKISAAEVEALSKNGLGAVADKLKEVEKLAPKADEAQAWNERAEKFAAANSNEHFLISVRFFEVADRFKGSDVSFAAQERSLKELQQAGRSDAAKAPETSVAPPAPKIEKAPVPAADKQKEVELVVRDLFKADFAKQAPADKLAFAKTLSLLSGQSPDPAEKYVQLREARDLAGAAGDVLFAVQQIAKIGETFAINEAEEKIAFLQSFSEKNRNRAALKPLAQAAAGVIDEAFAADLAAKIPALIQIAEKAAAGSDDKSIGPEIRAKTAIANANLREWNAANAAMTKLKTTPDDPALNLTAGRFCCFVRNSWDSGIPLLAKCSDAVLKAAALKEQGANGDAAAVAAAAGAWWDLGDKLLAEQKKAVQMHAAKLYESVLANLSGLAKTLADKRMAAVGLRRPGKGGGTTHDLLAAFDPVRDAIGDKWTKAEGTITSANAGLLRIAQFPFHAPAEYDLKVVFERVSGTGAVNFNFLWNHNLEMLSIGAATNKVAGFGIEEDRWDPESNKNTVKFELQNRRKYEVVIKVRKEGFGFSIDDETKIETHNKGTNVKTPGKYRMKDFDALGASCEDLVTFHTISVTDITGNGELTTDVKFSNRSGSAMGVPFKELAKDRVMTGMRLYWDGADTTGIFGLQPIYMTPQGRVEGKLVGAEKGKEHVLEARPGYVVGDVQVHMANGNTRAIMLVFNRLKGEKIEPTEKYDSPWVGGRKGTTESKVVRQGPFIGVYGTFSGQPDNNKLNSIGVIGKN